MIASLRNLIVCIMIATLGYIFLEGGGYVTIIDEDLITLAQAASVTTANGVTLSRRQLHHLCTQNKLVAQKIGTVWLVSRKSVEGYRPEETGFAAVWKKRRAQGLPSKDELQAAIEAGKKAKGGS